MSVAASAADAACLVPPEAGRLPHACLNCGAVLTGLFCAACGQEAHIATPTVGEFAREFLQDQIALEGKLLRTLKLLARRPGQLTLEYLEGRRQRYIRPLRLYLTMSVLYFAVAGLFGGSSAPELSGKKAADASPKAQAAHPPPAAPAKDADADDGDAASAGKTRDPLVQIDPGDYGEMRDFKFGYAPLDERLQKFLARPRRQAVEDFNRALRNEAPIAVFFVLPLFAALLKLGYLFRGYRYGVHLLFSLHLHAFVFLDLLVATIPWPGVIAAALHLAIPAYLLLALRRVYGGGLWSTGFWAASLLLLYAVLIGVALVAAAAVSVAIGN